MPGICRGGSHGPGQRGQVCERRFPEPSRCPSLFRLLWAGHCQSLSSGARTPANHCPRLSLAAPSHLSHNVYLVPGREAATTLVPCDLCMGLPCHHTAQIQGLPLSHCGGGGLDPDRWDRSWCCGDRVGEVVHALQTRWQELPTWSQLTLVFLGHVHVWGFSDLGLMSPAEQP